MLTLLGKGGMGADSETEAQDFDTDAKNMLKFQLQVCGMIFFQSI